MDTLTLRIFWAEIAHAYIHRYIMSMGVGGCAYAFMCVCLRIWQQTDALSHVSQTLTELQVIANFTWIREYCHHSFAQNAPGWPSPPSSWSWSAPSGRRTRVPSASTWCRSSPPPPWRTRGSPGCWGDLQVRGCVKGRCLRVIFLMWWKRFVSSPNR